MKIIIIDYGSGNLRSVAKSFERAAREADVAAEIMVSGAPKDVLAADRVVLPGVGAFADCKSGLEAVEGLHDALATVVMERARPFFGVCVGMQLMADVGHEFGDTPGLGWIAGDVMALTPSDPALKIPHMGWNDLELTGGHPVFDGIEAGEHAYFVHSYHFVPKDPAHVLARVNYGGPVTAAIGRDNMVGTQFHPEKSQRVGLHIIRNFLHWNP
ncbi:MAG: imidazole glycerol phosphate synthase subunit HisH [Alphaproteobacteria bacterium]|nr:imidazole glycerol phosphate synthase subunit HisH [Alphaproteobacteria bacterium]MBF0251643.1 imidazole glycerol phosphate synthase subunit HisH [Alphaproteobacteria bacterium]